MNQQLQDAFDEECLFGFEGPAGPTSALILGERRCAASGVGLAFLRPVLSEHLYKWQERDITNVGNGVTCGGAYKSEPGSYWAGVYAVAAGAYGRLPHQAG